MESAGPVTLASAYLDAGKSADALRVIAPLLASAPDDVRALVIASRASLGLGDLDEALRFIEAAGRIDPDNDQVWRVQAIILRRSERYAEAEESASVAQRLAPSSWLTHLARADVDTGRAVPTEDGLRAAREAVRLAPGEPDAHVAVGDLARIARDYPAATTAYRRALSIQPEHVAARNNLALIALQRGKAGAAARDFLGLLAFDPTSPAANLNVRLALRAAVTRALGAVFLVVMLELWGLSTWGFLPIPSAHPTTERVIAAVGFGLSAAIAGWRVLRFRRASGDRFAHLTRIMRTADRRSVVYGWIGVGVLSTLLVACFTPLNASVALCALGWTAIIAVEVDSRFDLRHQRQAYARQTGAPTKPAIGRARRVLLTATIIAASALLVSGSTVALARSAAVPAATFSADPGFSSGALQTTRDSCATVMPVLDQVEDDDFETLMTDPAADIQRSKTTVARVSARVDALHSEVSAGTVSMAMSIVTEALAAETTALNRYTADPSSGTENILDAQYQIQTSLLALTDSCADPDGAADGVQSPAEACRLLNQQTVGADLANMLRHAKGNPAKVIAAVNTYANDLESRLGQVTDPTIHAAAQVSAAGIRALARELKAEASLPDAGGNPLSDVVERVESGAQPVIAACANP